MIQELRHSQELSTNDLGQKIMPKFYSREFHTDLMHIRQTSLIYWPRRIHWSGSEVRTKIPLSDLDPWVLWSLSVFHSNLVSDGSVSILSNCEKCNLFLVFEIIFENVTFSNQLDRTTFPKSDIVIMNSHFTITLQWIHKLTGLIQFLLNRYCLKQCMVWHKL